VTRPPSSTTSLALALRKMAPPPRPKRSGPVSVAAKPLAEDPVKPTAAVDVSP
jgi:hypothetical protein